MEFLDPSGRPIASLTKILTVNVATADRDTVVFVSDQSSTPQTL
jgi:D-alanyl-D-alanine carboxypeptidase